MNTNLDKEMAKAVKENSVRKKPFKSQIPHALVLIALLVGLGFYLNDTKLVKYLIFGVAFGMILQRSRFCFTAAFRDPVTTGGTSLTRAAFLAVAVGTIGFSALSLYSISTGGKPLATDSVAPLSILTVIGGRYRYGYSWWMCFRNLNESWGRIPITMGCFIMLHVRICCWSLGNGILSTTW